MKEMEKMEMDEFAAEVCAAVKERLGSDYNVDVREVRKNNGVVLHGLTARYQQQNVAPTVYLEPFLELYGYGTAFGTVVRKVEDALREELKKEPVDMGFFRSFDAVRDRICYRLIGRAGNEKLLEEIPHTGFLDMEVCFYYAYQGEALGNGTILIYNSHMEAWGTCTEELMGLARENTPRLFPWSCRSLQEVLEEIALGGESFQDIPMKVLGNDRGAHGAACILYPGVLEEIAGEMGDFFILPSSIHEVVLLPDTCGVDRESLKKMVREVNVTQVAPEDVLSDTLYRYDRAGRRVVMA